MTLKKRLYSFARRNTPGLSYLLRLQGVFLTIVSMKFKKKFIDAIINNRIAGAGQWQVEVQSMRSNYVFITCLLKKEAALSPEIANRCRSLQEQLIYLLTKFVFDLDELDASSAASDSDSQALLTRHTHQMSELNGCIYTFLKTLHTAP